MRGRGRRTAPGHDVFTGDTLRELVAVIEIDGEYVSHLTALGLLGVGNHPATPFTVVTRRRRRNRDLAGYPLTFVTHGADRPGESQTISIGDQSIRVSTIEQTLVDLVTDIDHAPSLPDLANLFAEAPYRPDELLRLARQTSDTAYKRSAFLLAWSGQAGHPELPPADLTRTPVRLDPRSAEAAQNWDGRFFVRYPASLLEQPLPSTGDQQADAHNDWMALRNDPAVRRKMAQTPYLPLRDDPAPRAAGWFDELFRNTVASLRDREFEEFLASFTDTPPAAGRYWPRMMTRHIENRPGVFGDRLPEVRDWITRALGGTATDRVEPALRIAFALGMHDEVLQGIAKHGYRLFSAARFDLIRMICRRYIESEFRLASHVFVVAARAEARENRFDEAIAILDRGKSQFEDLDGAEADFGELALATGNLLRISGRLMEAMPELELARECFLSIRDARRVAATDNALGNLMMIRSRPEAARRYYLSALTAFREAGMRDSQASVLGNLGLVEHELGNPKRGALFLTRAVSLHAMLGNHWNGSVAALSLGKMHLAMGQMTKALRLFRDVYALRKRIRHPGGMHEAAAFIAWTCELLGKPGAADSWWDRLPDVVSDETRIQYVVETLRAMRLLLHGRTVEALDVYRSIYDWLLRRESSSAEIGDICYGIGSCLSILGSPETASYLDRALAEAARAPRRIQSVQLRIFCGLLDPARCSGLAWRDDMAGYPATGCFDPFWFLYAARLEEDGSPEATSMLAALIRKTPPDLLEGYTNRDRRLAALLKRFETIHLRAAEFVTLIREGEATPLHISQYTSWTDERPAGTLVIDGPAGIIRYETHASQLKTGSIPLRMLEQLILAHPHPVDPEALYAAAWGMPYDPECDPAALKSAVQRLSGLLRSVFPGAGLERAESPVGPRGIALRLPCRWEAVI
ncbi:MAG TPA: tetratricopeptide repeat protein [Candidatus Ozemobacteraceae bacterium]|nr:tetratricopeptide repeat protein [Candidatus Ozemobacteraceae bacterium]